MLHVDHAHVDSTAPRMGHEAGLGTAHMSEGTLVMLGVDEERKQKEESRSPRPLLFCVEHLDLTPLFTPRDRRLLLPCRLVLALSMACLLAGHSLEHLLLPHIH